MIKDTQPQQSEKLKIALSKANLAIGSFNNEAMAEQVAIAIKNKNSFPDIKIFSENVLKDESKLSTYLKTGNYTQEELEVLTGKLKSSMEAFKNKVKDGKLDGGRILETARDILRDWKTEALNEQIKIALEKKLPIGSALDRDLLNTWFNLNHKFNQEPKIHLEIMALSQKLKNLINRFNSIVEVSGYEHEGDEKKKNNDKEIEQAEIVLNGFQRLQEQNKLSLTVEEKDKLPKSERKRMDEFDFDTVHMAVQLNHAIGFHKSIIMIMAMKRDLLDRITYTMEKVQAIREEQKGQAWVRKMDDFFA